MSKMFISMLAFGLMVTAVPSKRVEAQIQIRLGGGYNNGYRPRYYRAPGPNYYNGYGQDYYSGYGPSYIANRQGFSSGYGLGNNRYSVYGAGPYAYGNPAYYGQSCGPTYNPGGFGVYSNFNNGW